MRRAAFGLVLALAIVVAPSAGAAGPTISYTVTKGTSGNNGWYVSPVTVSITVANATSTTCLSIETFTSSSDSYSCSASDGQATTQFSLQFKIDTTPPTVTSASVGRPADSNGWYNHAITITFVGTDSGSGIASCTTVTYSGPDSSTATVGGVCTDNAGNTSSAGAFAIKYDSTPPAVTATPARASDDNGWYSHAVGRIRWDGRRVGHRLVHRSRHVLGAGQRVGVGRRLVHRSGGQQRQRDVDVPFRFDAPKVTVDLSRKPDANGWYTRPVVGEVRRHGFGSPGSRRARPQRRSRGLTGRHEKVCGDV